MTEAQQLEIGSYAHWWDETREEWLTNWPAPPHFDGEELWIDKDQAVLGPFDSSDCEAEDDFGDTVERGYARTLSAAELQGLDRLEEADEKQRQERIALYRRASFGLASAAECASIRAANGGSRRFAGALPAEEIVRISAA